MLSLPLLVLAAVSPALAASYYPDPKTSELEHLLVDTGGIDDGGIKAAITPCGVYTMGTQTLGRMSAAQWIRVAFHDSAPANVSDGSGGLDASIGFETLRAENSGSAMNDTMGFFANYTSAVVSNADLLALGVVQSVGSCGGPNVPYKIGRVDATGPGNFGTPEPEMGVEETLARAKYSGYSQTEFIQLTACGHTMGATHNGGFPQIVGPEFITPNNTGGGVPFDSTKPVFDINVVNEYLTGTGQRGGAMVTTPNVTVRSDLRLYESDNNSTMKAMAAAGAASFANTCSTLFAKMINTVPKGVTLSDVLTPNVMKPVNVSLSLASDGGLEISGSIRLLSSTAITGAKITINWKDDYGFSFPSYSASASYKATGQSNFGETTFYSFSADVPITGISSFTVTVVNGKTTTTYNNGGNGYKVQDTAFYLPGASSLTGQTAVASVAVFQPIPISIFNPDSVTAVYSVPVPQQGTISPKISTVSSTLKYSKRSGLYSIYTSTTTLPTEYVKRAGRKSSVAITTKWGSRTYLDDFNKLAYL